MSIGTTRVRCDGEDGPVPTRRQPPRPQYRLSVDLVPGEEVPSDAVMQQAYADVDVFNAELRAAGAWMFAREQIGGVR